MRSEQRLELRIPGLHEVEPAFLHPAVEILLRDLVRIMKDRVAGSEDLDRSFFDGDAVAAFFGRIRCVVAGVEFLILLVVLHDQRSAVGDVIEQALIVLANVFASVIGADAEHDGAVRCEISGGEFFGRDQRDVESELLQHGGNVVARAHDVADLQILSGASRRRC